MSQSERFTLETELSRDLGLTEATTIVIGGIIGSGIFGAPAGIAQALGNPGLFMSVWVIGGLLGFTGALCFAELGAMMPRSGGQLVYMMEAFPPIVGFLYGWMEVVLIQSAGLAAIAVVCVSYLGYFIPQVSPDIGLFSIGSIVVSSQQVTIWILLWILCAVNYFGVRFGGTVMNVTTFAKVLALIGLAGVAVIVGGGDWGHFSPMIPPNIDWSLASIMGPAMIGALFAYQGWSNTNAIAGEVKDPQRTLPRAIFLGLGICTAVYLAVNWSYLYVLSIDEIAASERVATDVAVALIGPVGGSLISLAVMISTFGTMNGILMYTPRVPYAMAREGIFFEWFTHVHPRYRTPSRAIVALTAWAMFWTFLGSFQSIINAFVYAVYAYYGLCVIALLKLRKTHPDVPRPYRVPGYPWIPLFFLLITAICVVSILVEKTTDALPGLLCLGVGVPVYWIWFRKRD
jgi:basic amino acid/polyamine antiporter, APA family